MRATVLTPIILLSWSLQALGQPSPTPRDQKPSGEAQSPVASTPAPNGSPVATGPQLKQVVALFRHGVRAPLKEIDGPTPTPTPGKESADKPHAANPWPTRSDWGVKNWGDLTPHGARLARALGYDYAQTYRKMFARDFKCFLLPDVSERTVQTALFLGSGLATGSVPTTFPFPVPTPTSAHNPTPTPTPDPLFHPFEAPGGSPDEKLLSHAACTITANSQTWIDSLFAPQFKQLYDVLDCQPQPNCQPQANYQPLKDVTDNAARPCLSYAKNCSTPIAWAGQFSYANTASETFLLEYANKMKVVGWGRVLDQPGDGTAQLVSMMALHEFYFEKTQRDCYVAQILASNLLHEIKETLNGDKKPCRRIPDGYEFAGFVGHDTNIANVATLLKLSWKFTSNGTRGLPDSDPLPAGALIFELWKEGTDSFVRIFYAAQDLDDMRKFDGSGFCPAFRLPVQCGQYSNGSDTCKMPLTTFNDAVKAAIDEKFLSSCK